MSVTVNVNNLSLVHKGSSGVSMATLPDMCKTPPNSIPVPYPNIALSSSLAKGTTTVKADGGNMCAIYGSQFSRSNGDEAGTLGGVKSGTFMKEATWITYSFDVKLQGKGACRLTDKMFHNHQNTVNMAGVVQPALLAQHADVAIELQILCTLMCEVRDIPNHKQTLIASALWKMDDALKGGSTMKAEVPMDVARWSTATSDPSPLTEWTSKSQPWRATRYFGRIPEGISRRPDVLITTAKPIREASLRKVVEMKIDDADTAHSRGQIKDFEKMFKDKLITMEVDVDCICDDDPNRRKTEVPKGAEREKFVKKLVKVAKERKKELEAAAVPSLVDGLMPSSGTVAAAGAVVLVGALAVLFAPELAAGAAAVALFGGGAAVATQ